MYMRYTIQDKHRFCNLTKYRDNAPMVNLDLHLPMNAVPDASKVSSILALSEVELGTNLCDKVVYSQQERVFRLLPPPIKLTATI